METMRKPDTTRATLIKLQEEMNNIQKEIYQKWQK
jgi:hypothetical protein